MHCMAHCTVRPTAPLRSVSHDLAPLCTQAAELSGRRARSANPPHEPPRRAAAEEAARDVALLAALLRSHDAGGDSVAVAPLLGGYQRLLPSPCRALADYSRSRLATPMAHVRCCCEAEVTAALRLAVEEGWRVRPVGSRHSWSEAALVDGALCLDLTPMDRVLGIEITPSSGRDYTSPEPGGYSATVTVEPGVQLHELRRALSARGLTLPSWPMLLGQTAGGAVGTGSHGSGAEGLTSDQMVGARLVCVQADGSVRICTVGGGGGGGDGGEGVGLRGGLLRRHLRLRRRLLLRPLLRRRLLPRRCLCRNCCRSSSSSHLILSPLLRRRLLPRC